MRAAKFQKKWCWGGYQDSWGASNSGVLIRLELAFDTQRNWVWVACIDLFRSLIREPIAEFIDVVVKTQLNSPFRVVSSFQFLCVHSGFTQVAHIRCWCRTVIGCVLKTSIRNQWTILCLKSWLCIDTEAQRTYFRLYNRAALTILNQTEHILLSLVASPTAGFTRFLHAQVCQLLFLTC